MALTACCLVFNFGTQRRHCRISTRSHANTDRLQRRTSSSTTAHKTTPLHPPTDHLYQPLRIAFDTSILRSQMELSLSAGDNLAATKLFLLIYEILPGTAMVWGDGALSQIVMYEYVCIIS